MSGSNVYKTIRTGVASHISANIDWANVDNTFDYTPTDASVLFGTLPSVMVDFGNNPIRFEEITQGYLKTFRLFVQIYTEVEKSDASFGRDASEDLADKLQEIEDLFNHDPTIGMLVKGSTIRESKPENFEVEAVKLGLYARLAWISLDVYIVD